MDLGGKVAVEDEYAGLLEGEDEGGIGYGGLEADVAGIDGEGGHGAGALVHLVSALQRSLHHSSLTPTPLRGFGIRRHGERGGCYVESAG